MTWQPVPWFVAGGLHSPEVARLLAYAATGGKQGVVEATDCAVTELAVPAGSVQVLPGAVAVLNGSPGGGQQSYLARNPEAETVAITPTGSGGPRTDLIVAAIEDPQYPGTAAPADPTVGPYVFTRVIEDVAPGTTRLSDVAGHENDSAVVLASVTLPASTGTVLDSHITDLRRLVQPRSEPVLRTVALTTGQTDPQDTKTAGGEPWPNAASWSVDIPEWATKVRIVGMWNQVKGFDGGANGFLWVRLSDGTTTLDTEMTVYDTPAGAGANRASFVCADDLEIPDALRGATVTVNFHGRNTVGTAGNYVTADESTSMVLMADFIEEPV